MATRLYEVLSFLNVPGGGQATLPHHINVNGVAQIPDFLYPDASGFSLVAADAAGVTVQNNNAGATTLDLAVFFIYSAERLFGQVLSHLTPQPFFVSGGSAAAPGSNLWAPGTGAGSILDNNGTANLAGGDQSLAAGMGSSAPGAQSIALGRGSVASGAQSVALGFNSTASGAQSTAIGDGCTAAGSNSVALGDGATTQAAALDSFAAGSGSIAKGAQCVAMGDGCIAGTNGTTHGAVAIGEGAEADATGGCALNEGFATGQYALATNNGRADGKFSSAAGDRSQAIREAQTAHASGRFAVNGDAQSSWLEMRGSTPGAAPGEAVELLYGDLLDQTLQLEDGKGYTLTVTAVAKDTVAGGKGMQSFMQRYALRRAAGLTVIAAPGASDQFGDAASLTWTLVATVGAAPDRLVLTFTTTGAQAAARCVAKVEIVEVLNA